jgi:hypothetical protein
MRCWIGRSGPSKFPLEISILSRIFSRVSYERERERRVRRLRGGGSHPQHFSELIGHFVHLGLQLTNLVVLRRSEPEKKAWREGGGPSTG